MNKIEAKPTIEPGYSPSERQALREDVELVAERWLSAEQEKLSKRASRGRKATAIGLGATALGWFLAGPVVAVGAPLFLVGLYTTPIGFIIWQADKGIKAGFKDYYKPAPILPKPVRRYGL